MNRVGSVRKGDRTSTESEYGETLYFVSTGGGTMDLWQQRLGSAGTSTGSPERLTTGIGMTDAFFSSDSLSQNH